MLVKTWIAFVALVACDPRKEMAENRLNIVRLETKRLALEGYPLWARDHPNKACPDKIEELVAVTQSTEPNDPWGHPYVLLCGSSAPAGVRGAGVLSVGPDGKQGTADDIKSWDP
jgi:Type II secretion system (T2SS), protein G